MQHEYVHRESQSLHQALRSANLDSLLSFRHSGYSLWCPCLDDLDEKLRFKIYFSLERHLKEAQDRNVLLKEDLRVGKHLCDAGGGVSLPTDFNPISSLNTKIINSLREEVAKAQRRCDVAKSEKQLDKKRIQKLIDDTKALEGQTDQRRAESLKLVDSLEQIYMARDHLVSELESQQRVNDELRAELAEWRKGLANLEEGLVKSQERYRKLQRLARLCA
eukprot:gnl/MRDRNA2_/MRDRNA2_139530_c0_seq1.p1 gnl/MRDRNA2_/MRDRNA2_139530_c0~~gnl/MRDRNA2_/MRDRNA2_139530_c0_seq1.p1  ORF type:complete len:220 (+),score=41.69 gnl/MRDRNA2_/MRDRNA2_139530_c0_seq1:66-725(+)